MKGYNLLVIFDQAGERVLMCRRRKAPYPGLLNFLGGKIEPGEEGLDAACRELEEETGITRRDCSLTHFMDSVYQADGYYLEIYTGQLNGTIAVSGGENELVWLELPQDFFDTRTFAGRGLLGHILLEIDAAKERLNLRLKRRPMQELI